MFQGFVPKAAVFMRGAFGKRSNHGGFDLSNGFTAASVWKMVEMSGGETRWRKVPEGQLLSVTYPLLGFASQ